MERLDEPLDDGFLLLDALMEPPTIEEELSLEKRIRWFYESATIEQLRQHCTALERQHFSQAQFIANCMTELARCKAKIACLENPVKQPSPSFWERVLKG